MTTRIYIDSRERQNPDRTTNSDFAYALPTPINVTDGSKAMIEAVAIPNTINTIIEGVNDLFVLAERNQNGILTIRDLTLPPGYYSPSELAIVIAIALNGADKTLTNGYGCTFDFARNTFIIFGLLLIAPNANFGYLLINMRFL